MASFTNFATLSYNGGTTNSNTVTGELLEALTVTKTAVVKNYAANDKITYIISIVNSGAQPVTNLTVTDNLGAYEFNGGTVYPLAYVPNSVRYYVNGVLQTAPTATPEPPLVITVPNVPANGSIMLVYEAEVTAYAPLGTDGSITNTANVTDGNLEVSASETVSTDDRAVLTISKALCPAVVTGNGQITYTFVIENTGNTEASEAERIVLTDTFDPILKTLRSRLTAPLGQQVRSTRMAKRPACSQRFRGRSPFPPRSIRKTQTAHGPLHPAPRRLLLPAPCKAKFSRTHSVDILRLFAGGYSYFVSFFNKRFYMDFTKNTQLI